MTTTIEPRLVPGAMRDQVSRVLPNGGLVEFEFAPYGWTAKNGQPRSRDWRAYFYTAPDGQRIRVPSVTTLLDSICPKPGIPPWAEARGIEGAVRAIREGFMPVDVEPREAVERVRGLRLGADAARDEAADRGLSTHDIFETYMLTGDAPNLEDFPPEHHGYVQGAARWLLAANPDPVAVEELVCHPEAGYAGRSDLVAMIGGFRTRVDFKTSAQAGVYSSSHIQVGLYERAAVASGDEPTELQQVVVLAADGAFRSMPSAADAALVDAALTFYRAIKPVDALCDSANRAEKKARHG